MLIKKLEIQHIYHRLTGKEDLMLKEGVKREALLNLKRIRNQPSKEPRLLLVRRQRS